LVALPLCALIVGSLTRAAGTELESKQEYRRCWQRYYTLLVVFPALAKDYQAAVLSAGFIGISLGSTPTAIAAMTAVTKHYGPSPDAFVILPLASALFVSLVNVAAITLFLSL
jgi:sodium--glutamate symport carrier gltS